MDTEGQAVLKERMCWSCSAALNAEDKYCKSCGKGQGEHVPWYYRHWGIILSTVLGLGPFSIILAWRSPLISARARWIYTLVIGFVTAYVAIGVYHAVMMVQAQMSSVLQAIQP